MNSTKQLISNTFYLFLTWGSITIFSFLFWLIIGKLLDPWDYGIISTSLNLIIFLSAISLLGLGTVLVKFISEHKKNVEKYFYFIIKIVLITNLFIFLIFLIFNQNLSPILKLDTTILLISSVGVFFISFEAISNSVLKGLQKMKKIFVTSFAGQLSKIILCLMLIFLIKSYFDTTKLYLGPIIAFIVSYIITILLRLKPVFFRVKKYILADSEKKRLFKYSFSAIGGIIAILIFDNIQYIILTTLKDPSVTGVFTVGMMISKPIIMIMIIISGALFPIISQLSKNKNSKKQNYLLFMSLRYGLMIIIPLAFLLISFSKISVLIFSSEKYLGAVEFLPFLIFGSMFFGLSHLFTDILYASRKPNLLRNIRMFSAIIFLILSPIFVYLYSSFGLSFIYLFSTIVYFILSFIFVRKYISFKLPVISIVKIIISSSLLFTFLYFFSLFIRNIFLALLLLLPSILIYLVSLYALKFYTIQDVKILEYFGKRVPFFGHHILAIATFLRNRL